jgi:hypothetical protein
VCILHRSLSLQTVTDCNSFTKVGQDAALRLACQRHLDTTIPPYMLDSTGVYAHRNLPTIGLVGGHLTVMRYARRRCVKHAQHLHLHDWRLRGNCDLRVSEVEQTERSVKSRACLHCATIPNAQIDWQAGHWTEHQNMAIADMTNILKPDSR